MDLRTKPIEQAIVFDEGDDRQRLVVYEPGDGTRYVVLFNRIDFHPDVHTHMGAPEVASLVTLVNFGRRSMIVGHGQGYLAPRYVEEKLGFGLPSAVTMAELIARYTDRDALTPEEAEARYERQGD